MFALNAEKLPECESTHCIKHLLVEECFEVEGAMALEKWYIILRAYSYTHGLQDYVHAFVVEKCFKAEGTMHGIGEMVHNLKSIVVVFKIMYMHLWPPGSSF